MLFSNSRKMGTKPGSKCTNMDDDGQLKVYSLSVKRIFGETVRASSTDGMISEIQRAFIFYNIIICI
jgi:hypothetical protein